MNDIQFITRPLIQESEDVFVIHLSDIENENDLFQQLNDKLLFPSDFGFNWDDLSDYLTDFHWIKQREIIIIHDDYPELSKKELGIYFRVLIKAIQDWREAKEHTLDIIFPERFLYHRGFAICG